MIFSIMYKTYQHFITESFLKTMVAVNDLHSIKYIFQPSIAPPYHSTHTAQLTQCPLYISAKDCSALPQYTYSTADTTSTSVGSKMTIVCNVGYEREDGNIQATVECLPSTHWNDTTKDCTCKFHLN